MTRTEAFSSFETNCPFCDGKISDACDTNTGRAVGMIHSMPPCETFDRLPVEDFVSAVNAKNRSDALILKKPPGTA
jgi:hypothetical protein